ncbi:MAG: hypothetical protein PW734_01605 [Verrucomicrobium sp.]|nr:hypothetical protein [Verrucomicrobium sp.]
MSRPSLKSVDLSQYCHFSASRLADVAPRILDAKKVHASGDAERQATAFYNTLRNAADGLVSRSMLAKASRADYAEIGRLVWKQTPQALREPIAAKARENLEAIRRSADPRGLFTSSPASVQARHDHLKASLASFGLDLSGSTRRPAGEGARRVAEALLMAARCC